MYNIFRVKNNHLLRVDNIDNIVSVNEIIWVDIIRSHDDYKYSYMPNILDQNIVRCFNFEGIKKNGRFFKSEYGLHMHSFFFSYDDQDQIVSNSTIFFSIYNDCLYTLRNEKIPMFCAYQKNLHNHLLVHGNVYELLLNLFEIKLDDIADRIEQIYGKLEKLSLIIMDGQKIEKYAHVLYDLSILEKIVWKIRINLLDTERAIKFLVRKAKLPIVQVQYANEILENVALLSPHSECIFKKVSFLIQDVMGFISIEQNRIIKIFSVIFLPPTLIASSYGMNFEFMPELRWSLGYPVAIILMILTGLAPYLYFKYKNWL